MTIQIDFLARLLRYPPFMIENDTKLGRLLHASLATVAFSLTACDHDIVDPVRGPSELPGWSASIRLYEPSENEWVAVLAGERGVAVATASCPEEGVEREYGKISELGDWRVEARMIKLNDGDWYVCARSGVGIAMCRALGDYDESREVVVEPSDGVGDSHMESRVIRMEDDARYVVVASGLGISLRPMP